MASKQGKVICRHLYHYTKPATALDLCGMVTYLNVQSTNTNPAIQKSINSLEIKTIIENHKIVAAHLQAAASRHLAASYNYESGDSEGAALNTYTAQRHLSLVSEISFDNE